LNTLSRQALTGNSGTSAPRSVAVTPEGLKFLDANGIYLLDHQGVVTPVTNKPSEGDQDLEATFINVSNASRASGAYGMGVYRIAVDTRRLAVDYKAADFWFDHHFRRWSGAHSFQYDCIEPYETVFVLSSSYKPGALYVSLPYPAPGAVYQDDGQNYLCGMTTAFLPDVGDMSEKQIVETTSELAPDSTAINYSIQAIRESGQIAGSATLSLIAPAYSWGAAGDGFFWGGGLWTSTQTRPVPRLVPWSEPIVFSKLALQINFRASKAGWIGKQFFRYQSAGYTLQ
jgi:hypothetical protein